MLSEPHATATNAPQPHALVVCTCGAVLVTCPCARPHSPARILEACGRCTCTGGEPVIEQEDP